MNREGTYNLLGAYALDPRLDGVRVADVADGRDEGVRRHPFAKSGAGGDDLRRTLQRLGRPAASVHPVAASGQLGADEQPQAPRGARDEGDTAGLRGPAHGWSTTLMQPSCFFWNIE